MVGIPLQEILKLPLLKNAKLVSGKASLDRYVTGITVAEVPDIVSWAKNNTIYLSTLFAFKDDESLRSLVRGLHAKGAAALFVKPKRFYEDTPAALIDEAKRLNFPVFEIEEKIKWSDIIRAVFEKIIEQSYVSNRELSLFQSLLEGDTEDTKAQLLNYLNIQPRQPFRLALISILPNRSRKLISTEEINYRIKATFRKLTGGALTLEKRNSYFVVFSSSRIIESSLKKLVEDLKNMFSSDLILIVSDDLYDPKEIYSTAEKLKQLLKIAGKLKLRENLLKLREFEHLLLLNSLIKMPETIQLLEKFQQNIVQAAGPSMANNLLLTINTFLDSALNKTKTALKLNTHINTVKYRLKRFEEITGFNLQKTEDLFKLYLIFSLLKLKGGVID